MKIPDSFTLRTVRKKILLLSKIAGILLVLSYIFFTRLPLDPKLSSTLWFLFVVALVLAADYLMGRFISKPAAALSQSAAKMAKLDFSSPCTVDTQDEFGDLSHSLNTMASNLQQAIQGLEKANAKLEKDVEQEHRLLAEREELVDRLSHEMKTPLGVIRAYAEGLQDETDEQKKQKYSQIIIDETQHLNHLINTLLDLSALENGASVLTPERFDFVEFVETVAGRLLLDIPDKNFQLEYELPEEKMYVYTDKARLEQVLNNLIVNARKNVVPQGVLKLSLTCQDNLLHFSIFNEGPPIPQDNLPKIWTKFYRDKDARYSGSGLGLAIVAQILSMQSLPYGVKNLPGGVVFYFFIPTAQEI